VKASVFSQKAEESRMKSAFFSLSGKIGLANRELINYFIARINRSFYLNASYPN